MLYGMTHNVNGSVSTVIVTADKVDELVAFPKKAAKFSNLYYEGSDLEMFDMLDIVGDFVGYAKMYRHNNVSHQEEFVAHMGLILGTSALVLSKSKKLAETEEELTAAIKAEEYRVARYEQIANGEIESTPELDALRGKTLGEEAGIDKFDPWAKELDPNSAAMMAMYGQRKRDEGKMTQESFKHFDENGISIDRLHVELDEDGNPILNVEVSKFTKDALESKKNPDEMDLSPEAIMAMLGAAPATRKEGAIYLEDATRLLDVDDAQMRETIISKLGLEVSELPSAKAIKLPSTVVPGIFHTDGVAVKPEDFANGYNVMAAYEFSTGNFNFMIADANEGVGIAEIHKDGIKYFLYI